MDDRRERAAGLVLMGGEGLGEVTFLFGVCRQPTYRAGVEGFRAADPWGPSRVPPDPTVGVELGWVQSCLLAPDMVEVFCLGSAGSAHQEQGLHSRWSQDPEGRGCW